MDSSGQTAPQIQIIMKVFECNKLTHTLQTYLGMVRDDGRPKQRLTPRLPDHLEGIEIKPRSSDASGRLPDEGVYSIFTDCVLQRRLPAIPNGYKPGSGMMRFQANINACCSLAFSIDYMKRSIVALNRLDLEQAAAVVIATVWNDPGVANKEETVSALIRELGHSLLTDSCMWLEYSQWSLKSSVDEEKLSGFVRLFRRMLWKTGTMPEQLDDDDHAVYEWSDLLPLLLRVRRISPRSRCLFIPNWIFEAAHTKPPSNFAIWDRHGFLKRGHEPHAVSSPGPEDIVLGRKAFRGLQRRMLAFDRFWEPETCLRKAIADLEANVIYGTKHIKSMVLPSSDSLLVAHYFFALQRRLQRKVVSDLNWTGFLGKGESGNVLQNNPDIPTTFEKKLSDFSGQTGVPVTNDVLPQIDQCCLLMEEYVSIYGDGDRNNLVFVPGRSGGSGRGAVDQYNLLCDILTTLSKAAKEQGLRSPGRVRKFLAKDIMTCNDSFCDDAFANGKAPEWETWLAHRREEGILQRMQDLKVSEDTATPI